MRRLIKDAAATAEGVGAGALLEVQDWKMTDEIAGLVKRQDRAKGRPAFWPVPSFCQRSYSIRNFPVLHFSSSRWIIFTRQTLNPDMVSV